MDQVISRITRSKGVKASSVPSTSVEAILHEVCSAALARGVKAGRGGRARDGSRPMRERKVATALLVDLLKARRRGNVDLGPFLNRCATRVLAASPDLGVLMTNVAEVRVPRDVARAVAAIVAELAYVSGTSSPPDAVAQLFVALDLEGDDLVLAIACPEAAANPVPTSAAAACLARAGTLASMLGGTLVRGVRDGSMLYGTTFALGRQR